MVRHSVPPGRRALRAVGNRPSPRRRPAPAHAGVSLLAAPHSVAVSGTLAAVTAVVATVALTVGSTGRTQAPRPQRNVADVGQPMVRTAGDLNAADVAGGVLSGGLQGSVLIGFGGGADEGAAESARAPVADLTPPSALASDGIPSTALAAYQDAAKAEAAKNPKCRLPWPLLAGIGRVESNHGRFAGAVLQASGVSTPPIIGIPLNGNGTALIRDTDGGRLDGDTVYDRAVGPMQFIPSTWTSWGRDGNKDGVKDPFNVFDAAAAAADYLCAAGRDLGTYRGQVAAILSYNHSDAYVSEVLGLEKIYASGAVGVTIPVIPAKPDAKPGKHVAKPTLPPVDPGPPRALIPPTKPAGCAKKVSTPCPGSSSSSPGTGTTTPPVTADPGEPSTDPTIDPPVTDPPVDPTTSDPPVDPTTSDPPIDPTTSEPDPEPTDSGSDGDTSSADDPGSDEATP